MNRESLRARQEALDRFNKWEAQHPPGPVDFATAWDWYRGAWALARAWGTIPTEPAIDMTHIQHLTLLHERLARLR